MALAKGHKTNLETIIRAANDGALAVLEVEEIETGAPAALLVAVVFDGTNYNFTPMARMFDDNPYERYRFVEEGD